MMTCSDDLYAGWTAEFGPQPGDVDTLLGRLAGAEFLDYGFGDGSANQLTFECISGTESDPPGRQWEWAAGPVLTEVHDG